MIRGITAKPRGMKMAYRVPKNLNTGDNLSVFHPSVWKADQKEWAR
jgi:hypothetical protein